MVKEYRPGLHDATAMWLASYFLVRDFFPEEAPTDPGDYRNRPQDGIVPPDRVPDFVRRHNLNPEKYDGETRTARLWGVLYGHLKKHNSTEKLLAIKGRIEDGLAGEAGPMIEQPSFFPDAI